MLVPIRKSYLSQQVKILSYTFSFHLLMTGWCNTTVGFIDNEIVGPNPGIDDLTSIPFPAIMSGYRMPTGVGFAGSILV